MGHKAMVAYEVSNSMYDVYFSDWGADAARLAEKISEDTPFGGEKESPGYVDRVISDTDSEGEAGRLTDRQSPKAVKPEPKRQSVTIDEAAKSFFYLTVEAFYVVSRDYNVNVYVPVPYLKSRGDAEEHGVLLQVQPEEYDDIFHATRKPEWVNSYDDKREWKQKIAEKYSERIAPFSPVQI